MKKTKLPAARRERLTREKIALAACALIDAEGIEAFSTRKLAAILGVEAMALYHHFPSKAALFDAVVELLLQGIEIPETGDWRSRFVQGLHSFYQIAERHPRSYLLLSDRRWNTPLALQFYEQALTVLCDDGGLTPVDAARLFRGAANYVNGAALVRIASFGKGRAPSQLVLEATPPSLAAYPHVARVAPYLRAAALDGLFAETIERVVDALLPVDRGGAGS